MISGATTIYGIARPWRAASATRLGTTGASFPTTRPIGAVSDSGNLICGRQLRPAILLETSPVNLNSPVPKREILLRPCLAAASSPAGGSESAG